jgi:hypothetical protein
MPWSHGNGIGVPPVFFKKSLGLVAHDHEVVMLPQFEQTTSFSDNCT